MSSTSADPSGVADNVRQRVQAPPTPEMKTQTPEKKTHVANGTLPPNGEQRPTRTYGKTPDGTGRELFLAGKEA